MKTIQVLIRAATVAMLIGIPQLISSQKVADSTDILNRPAEEVRLNNATTPDILAEALIDANVPGGIAASSRCGGFQSRFLNPATATLRGILDAVVSAEPDYVDHSVINVPTFAPGEPIILKVTLSNPTDAEIYVIESAAQRDNKLEIKNASGEKLPLSEQAKKWLEAPVLRSFLSAIGPRQAINYKIDVRDWYDLTGNGAYTVTVKRSILLQDKKKFAGVESNPVTFIIQQ